MDIYLPKQDYKAGAQLLRTEHLTESVDAALAVMRVVHEDQGEHELPAAKHPVVAMWRNNLPWAYEVGMSYAEEADARMGRELEAMKPGSYARAAVLERRLALHAQMDALSRQIDLATTAEYTMQPPIWWDHEAVFAGYRSMLYRLSPYWYGALNDFDYTTVAPLPYR